MRKTTSNNNNNADDTNTTTSNGDPDGILNEEAIDTMKVQYQYNNKIIFHNHNHNHY